MFEPKDGKAIWRKIYDRIENLEIGDELSFDEITAITERELAPSRTYVYRASKELLKMKKKMLTPLIGKGYQVVEGMEIFDHAKGRQKRGAKQIKLASFEGGNIDTLKLSAEQKSTLNNFLVHNREIAMALRQKTDRIDAGVRFAQYASEHASQAAAFSADELAELKELLRQKKEIK